MENKITNYVIDACALIAYFRKEQGSEKLKELFKNENNIFSMHSINLGEVYYDTLRISSEETADEILADTGKIPIRIIWSIDLPFIKKAGKYKVTYKILYADSFVLALADREKAIIITTDHHEFDEINNSTTLNFFWLR